VYVYGLLERVFSCTCWIEGPPPPSPRNRINIPPSGGAGGEDLWWFKGISFGINFASLTEQKFKGEKKRGGALQDEHFLFVFFRNIHLPHRCTYPPTSCFLFPCVSLCFLWFWSFSPRACQSVYSRCSKETHHHGSQFSSLFFYPSYVRLISLFVRFLYRFVWFVVWFGNTVIATWSRYQIEVKIHIHWIKHSLSFLCLTFKTPSQETPMNTF
jgi:hypothetical protein